jgi:alpha-tubulin suppressor-like RCC1 family protein
LEAEVLPRRIEALAQTGRRFVAVIAGAFHALALAEKGELYGWGSPVGNGHGHERDVLIPHQVTAFVGQRVKHVDACAYSSCAVTEKGDLYTWGDGASGQLGHGDGELQVTPKLVKGLDGVKVAAAATCYTHTLVADEDGVVWAFGERTALGLGDPDGDEAEHYVWNPTPIPTLRVRARKSPDVLPLH